MGYKVNNHKSIDTSQYTEDENYPEYVESIYEYKITPGFSSIRIDKFLTQATDNATRSKVQNAIKTGRVTVNGEVMIKTNYKIRNGDFIRCVVLKAPPLALRPEDIPLDIVYEDEHLLVVNKPPNMVVHPGLGNRYGTLVNALLRHFGHTVEIIPDVDDEDEGKIMASPEVRPGIIHRIDKDTSGLLVVGKSNDVLAKLQKQFAAHTTERTYYALTWGKYKNDAGFYDGDVGRHPRNRKLYWVVKKGGRHARTDYKAVEHFDFATMLELKLHTGRTHQIRVHCSNDRHPLIGDKDYGGDKYEYGSTVPEYRQAAKKIVELTNRQMLHAKTLGFVHPVKNEFMQFDSEIPDDFKQIVEVLRSVRVNRSKLEDMI